MDKNLLIAVTTFVVIIFMVISAMRRRKNKNLNDRAVTEGRFTTGRVLAVQHQTGFDRSERNRSDIRLKVEYREPTTGETRIVRHSIGRTTPNVPPSITGVGAGLMDIGAIRKRHKEMKAYAQSLEAQGSSEDEVKQAVITRTLQLTEESTGGLGGEADAEGYVLLKELVEVDVYLHVDTPMRSGIHVVFRK